MTDDTPQGFSVADLCRRWKVGPDKIRAFLRRGELVGVNDRLQAKIRGFIPRRRSGA